LKFDPEVSYFPIVPGPKKGIGGMAAYNLMDTDGHITAAKEFE
jgi:hypothetical protein